MIRREIVNKKTGEKLIMFEETDFEHVNPIKHYGDGFIVKQMILRGVPNEELNGGAKISDKSMAIFKAAATHWSEMMAGFRKVKIPDNLITLLSSKKKGEQEKLLKAVAITPDILMAFLIRAYEEFGYTLSSYSSEHASKGVDSSKMPLAYEVKEDGGVKVYGNTELSEGQLRQAIEQRRVKVGKFLDNGDQWHCFFTTYSYYKHGPLARTVIGQQQVQGIDYAYNLQGWLKGINSTAVGDGTYDIGGDGRIGGNNVLVARDVYGFSLNYFQTTINSVTVSDYKSINTSATPFVTVNNANSYTGKQLFNGNISSMVINTPKLGEGKVYQYGYDQLNRLLAMDVFEGISNTNNSFTPAALTDYKERLTYSANGNIQSYLRNGTGTTINLNNYSYSYTSGTNRLASVSNSVNGQTKSYSYDAIGNTTADGMQAATNIIWNVYGKVQSLTNALGQPVSYTYDAMGNRISKTVAGVTEWYVRDASGNNIATYTKSTAINSGNLTVTEWYKYGSSLLSISTRQVNVEQAVTGEITTMQRGFDGYILTDHLGNTRVTITDRKLQHTTNGTTVDYYIADVKTANYYSSYGSTAKSYNQQPLVAFNGQRKSTEIGTDAQTALFWEYNGDVGKRWNLDPKSNSSISAYTTFGGNPVLNLDLRGDTLSLGNNDATRNDINSLVTTENRGFINLPATGRDDVTLKESIKVGTETIFLKDAIKKDKGLALLYDLVKDNKNYFYNVTLNRDVMLTDLSVPGAVPRRLQENLGDDAIFAVGNRVSTATPRADGGFDFYRTFENTSFTLRGDEASALSNNQITPNKTLRIGYVEKPYTRRYDGTIRIAPGDFEQQVTTPSGTQIHLVRSKIVYHELRENYYRVNGASYAEAHAWAMLDYTGGIPRIPISGGSIVSNGDMIRSGANTTSNSTLTFIRR